MYIFRLDNRKHSIRRQDPKQFGILKQGPEKIDKSIWREETNSGSATNEIVILIYSIYSAVHIANKMKKY